MMIVIKW